MQPETTTAKQFEFTGSAGSFFVMYLIVTLSSIVPIIGWAFAFNYQNNWLAKNLKVNGRQLAYKAGFGEALVFLLVGILLIIVTLGIYIFWFAPKTYRFIAEHMYFADEATVASPAPAAVSETTPEPTPVTVNDVTPPTTPPAAPTSPAGLIQ